MVATALIDLQAFQCNLKKKKDCCIFIQPQLNLVGRAYFPIHRDRGLTLVLYWQTVLICNHMNLMLIWSMGVGWNIAAMQPVSTRKIIHINEVGKCTKTEKQYLRCEQRYIGVMMSGVYRVTTRHFAGRNPIYPVKHWNNIITDENIKISEEITSGELLYSMVRTSVTSCDRAAKTMYRFLTHRICNSRWFSKHPKRIFMLLFCRYEHPLIISVS